MKYRWSRGLPWGRHLGAPHAPRASLETLAAGRMNIVAVIDNESTALSRASDAVQHGADLLEIRCDLFEHVETDIDRVVGIVKEIRSAVTVPIIGTIRKFSQFGKYTLDETVRTDAFKKLLPYCDIIDIEDIATKTIPIVAIMVRDEKKLLIISHHNLFYTPDVSELQALAEKMVGQGADIVKIATAAMDNIETNFESVSRMMTFTRDFKARHSRRRLLASMVMGHTGAISRILLPYIGSCLTYASIGDSDLGRTLGQIPVDELARYRSKYESYDAIKPLLASHRELVIT